MPDRLPPPEPHPLVERWCALDRQRAILAADVEAIEATRAVRALVVELLLDGERRDLFAACATLGRLTAARGGSPTLGALVVDGLEQAVAEREAGGPPAIEADALRGARAALAEGYWNVRKDEAAREAAAGWEFPRCSAPLDEDTCALVAGFPEDDPDALAAWAARTAHAAALAGVRRAVVAGGARATAALNEALHVAGIESHRRYPQRQGRMSWLPWRRSAE